MRRIRDKLVQDRTGGFAIDIGQGLVRFDDPLLWFRSVHEWATSGNRDGYPVMQPGSIAQAIQRSCTDELRYRIMFGSRTNLLSTIANHFACFLNKSEFLGFPKNRATFLVSDNFYLFGLSRFEDFDFGLVLGALPLGSILYPEIIYYGPQETKIQFRYYDCLFVQYMNRDLKDNCYIVTSQFFVNDFSNRGVRVRLLRKLKNGLLVDELAYLLSQMSWVRILYSGKGPATPLGNALSVSRSDLVFGTIFYPDKLKAERCLSIIMSSISGREYVKIFKLNDVQEVQVKSFVELPSDSDPSVLLDYVAVELGIVVDDCSCTDYVRYPSYVSLI